MSTDIDTFKKAIDHSKIIWRQHALTRMLERGISREEIKTCIRNGEIIECYDNDKPFPSVLIYGSSEKHILHVLAAYGSNDETCYIVTAYKPDEKHFKNDLRTRR